MQQLNLPGITDAYRLKIVQDHDPMNPRTEWDNLGRMACAHRDYDLGDKDAAFDGDAEAFMLELAEHVALGTQERWEAFEATCPYGAEPGRLKDWRHDRTIMWERLVARVVQRHYIMADLYLYDHSGLAMSTGSFSCPWDSGQVGFIYVSREQVLKEYGWKRLTAKRREQIETYLTGEVETYDQYLQGQVYGFVVEKFEDGDWVEDDACWGFYGDDIDGVHCHLCGEFTREHVRDAFDRRDSGWVYVGTPVQEAA